MRITLPDVNFDIAVDYPDETGIGSWEVTISLGRVPLITRSYSNDYERLRAWREGHHDEPSWYAVNVEDAKEKCITEFGHELRRALSVGSTMTPIGGTT